MRRTGEDGRYSLSSSRFTTGARIYVYMSFFLSLIPSEASGIREAVELCSSPDEAEDVKQCLKSKVMIRLCTKLRLTYGKRVLNLPLYRFIWKVDG